MRKRKLAAYASGAYIFFYEGILRFKKYFQSISVFSYDPVAFTEQFKHDLLVFRVIGEIILYLSLMYFYRQLK